MVLPFRNIPTHTQAYTVPNIPLQYQTQHTSHLVPPPEQPSQQHQHQHPQQHLVVPQPTIPYSPALPAEENAVLHAPEPTVIPSPPIQYTITPSHQLASLAHGPSLQYAPQQVQFQPSLEYILPPKHQVEYQTLQKSPHISVVPHYTQNYAQSFTPTLDLFGAYNKQPTSLLDSYIPSSVIIARQRALGRQLYQQQHQHQQQLHHHHHHQVPSFNIQQYGSHQPGYNTIAYSTAQGYGQSKRAAISLTTNTLGHKKN